MKKPLLIAMIFFIELNISSVLSANKWHEILGISENASKQEIEQVFLRRKQVLQEKIYKLKNETRRTSELLNDPTNSPLVQNMKKGKDEILETKILKLIEIEQFLEKLFEAYNELMTKFSKEHPDTETIFEME